MRRCWRKLLLCGKLPLLKSATLQPQSHLNRTDPFLKSYIEGGFASHRAFSAVPRAIFSLNKKISHLIRIGRLPEARILFDKAELRNSVTWNSMITGYVKRRDISKARKLFDEMPERDITSWNLMISGYMSSYGFTKEGRRLFEEMSQRDCVSWNTMISGYAKNGMMDEALSLFRSMNESERNVISWNSMVSGFLSNRDVAHAVEFFKQMPVRDASSLSALVSGLIQNDKLDEAARFLLEHDGSKADILHAFNTLIAGYGQKGRLEEARRLFDEIPVGSSGSNGVFERNLVSWNTMIMCYIRAGDVVSARRIFDEMTERDNISWNTMISGYAQLEADMEEASNLFHEMPNPDTLSWNSMVSGYAECGDLKHAMEFFEKMPRKNHVSWNSIIAAYEKNEDFKGAIKIFIRMLLAGKKPDRHTLSSVLAVCTGLVDLHLGLQIHQLVAKTVIADVPIKNSLITMYSRCGAITEARTIFDEVKLAKDVISWNAMIGGYASHGFADEALQVFNWMKKLDVRPTYITFISVLSCCAHAGLVEEGKKNFDSMSAEYNIEPTVEHYASLVDIVGKHGELNEAMGIISRMPFEADKAVWGALLGACRLHNDVELGRVAAEALMKLEPESSAPYVMLYNMYADAGQWDAAAQIRDIMDKLDIKKHTGHSRIDSSHSDI